MSFSDLAEDSDWQQLLSGLFCKIRKDRELSLGKGKIGEGDETIGYFFS